MNASAITIIKRFAVIAHVDSGKSTLVRELMWMIISSHNSSQKREELDSYLDNLLLEKEREITIKLKPISLQYFFESKNYLLNFIDTPGHVDFSYEVVRSLEACEGVILLVDGVKGVQAQTISYYNIANNLGLKIIPAINKIDSPLARVDFVSEQIFQLTKHKKEEIILVSARKGIGVDYLTKRILSDIPSVKIDINSPLKALVFDLFYNKYYGVTVYVKMISGSLKKGSLVSFLISNKKKIYKVDRVGIRNPRECLIESLDSGYIGWFSCGIKEIEEVKVGDTVCDYSLKEEIIPLKEKIDDIKPNVFSNFYPDNNTEYGMLEKALHKLRIQDNSFIIENVESNMLGAGFNCGFSGPLHKEIIAQRLSREYNCELIVAPSIVSYRIFFHSGRMIETNSIQRVPANEKIISIEEPFILLNINSPEEYIGEVSKICKERRGVFISKDWKISGFVLLQYHLPFSEFINDFSDKIKSVSKGYVSFHYEFIPHKQSDIVKIDLLLNGTIVPDLSFFSHKDFSYQRSRIVCERLKETLSRQSFSLAIQACIGKQVIARETLSPYRKDVTQRIHGGGDATRKKKLLEKQKKGKEKMKNIGKITMKSDDLKKILR